jgi:hypothetical protein
MRLYYSRNVLLHFVKSEKKDTEIVDFEHIFDWLRRCFISVVIFVCFSVSLITDSRLLLTCWKY